MRSDFAFVEALAEILEAIAAELAAEGAKSLRRFTRRRGGRTLRPGPATPMWNELTTRVRMKLTRYGDKAQLARLLGLPRQRLQDCLKARTATLDAERTLMLLAWVIARERGKRQS
jgi:hypothetical protein